MIIEPGKGVIKEKDVEGDELLRKKIMSRPRNFPDFIEAYLEYTKNQESTEKIHRWVAVSVIAAALERRVWVDAGHFRTYPNFYIFIIGNSGEVRKSTSTGIGFDLVKSLGTVHLMSERVTDRSLIDQMGRAKKEFYLENRKIFQSPVYAYASELVVFMREVAGNISELLTTFWDCADKWTYEMKSEAPIVIEKPCLNILGASTPTWLQRAIPVEEMEGGLASRIIFVVELEPPKRYNPWGVEDVSGLADMKDALLADLTQISMLVGRYTPDAEAKQFYDEWYIAHKKDTSKVLDIRFTGYHSRKPVTVWKLAMVFAASEGNSLTFGKKHMQKALAWLNDLEETMLQAFGNIGQNKLSYGLKRVIDLLKKKKNRRRTMNRLMVDLYNDFNGDEVKKIVADGASMNLLKTVHDGPHGMTVEYIEPKDEDDEM